MIYRLISVVTIIDGVLLTFDPLLEIRADRAAMELKRLEGTYLSEEEFAAVIETISRPALEYGAKQLGIRPLSRREFEKKLSEKGFDHFLVECAAEKLEEIGALDDYDYAKIFAEDRSLRGFGVVRITSELRKRGVDAEAIEEAVEALPDSEDEIIKFVERRSRGELLDRKTAKKISDALMRRGFSWDEISTVMSRYMDE